MKGIITLNNIDNIDLLTADVKLKYCGDVVGIYNALKVEHDQSIEELIDDFDSKVWSYIRTIDNREAKDILARISKEIMDEYLGEEE